MTITKRTMVQFFLLAMTGVGVAMCVGILIGTNLTGSDAGSRAEGLAEAEPVALAVTPVGAVPGCELVPVDAEDIGEDPYRGDEGRDGRQDRDGSSNSGANSATNSGTIDGSQFSDGGFGDIGQQWWNVTVNGHVTNVHVSGTGNIVSGHEMINNFEVTTPAPDTPVVVADSTPTATTPVDTTPVTTPATTVPTTTPTTTSTSTSTPSGADDTTSSGD